MTTVTINDELRKKLKRLAAKYDTNQADIIKRALELFEKYERKQYLDRFMNINEEETESTKALDDTRKSKILEMLAEAITKFEKKYPEIALRRKKLRQNIDLFDEITMTNWALPFEE